MLLSVQHLQSALTIDDIRIRCICFIVYIDVGMSVRFDEKMFTGFRSSDS